MSDTVLIVLIVAIVVVVVLFMFRDTLSRFFIKANRDGIEAELEARERPDSTQPTVTSQPTKPHSVNISGNRQVGKGHKISVQQSDVNVSDVDQIGSDHKIEVKAQNKPKKKKK